MTKVNDALARAKVLDEGNETREVASLWAERPVVLAFVRHFG